MHTNILQLDVARKWVCFDYALTTHGQSFSKLIRPFTMLDRPVRSAPQWARKLKKSRQKKTREIK